MLALLPPSSSVTRFSVSAAHRMMCLPTAVDPVKPILATSGWSTSRCPAVAPSPTTTLKTPSGMPASSASSARRRLVSGVSSLGLSTTVLPHANAGPSFHDAISIGKFHGVISPTTPSGSCNVIASPSPHGSVVPVCLSTAPA